MKSDHLFFHFLVILFLPVMNSLSSCSGRVNAKENNTIPVTTKEIDQLLDSFHLAASQADFGKYFSYYTNDAIFTGTDATERWNKSQFMEYAKPHFDKGKAWNFSALDRHIYFNRDSTTIWFDELLNTQMKICRGSGVLVNQDGEWKISQYILTATIPNERMDSVVKLKAPVEDELIQKLQQVK